MNKLFGIILMAFAFASCQNSGDRKITTTVPAAPITVTTPPAPGSNNAGTQINTTANGAATVALNPEHGAPGHNCDLPVGAPLNGPSGSTPAPVINANPAPVTLKIPASPQPANNNVRLNPAHGAPGHDCSIPVGQPLKN